jgi:hypothetical protein
MTAKNIFKIFVVGGCYKKFISFDKLFILKTNFNTAKTKTDKEVVKKEKT